jgi:hypothetical protein
MSAADDAAFVGISRLHAAYADVVTRRAWPELTPLFLPDAAVHIDPVTRPAIDVVGPEALGEFIAGAVARFEFFELVVLNSVAQLTGADGASGRMWIEEVRQEASSGDWSQAFGRYDDDYVLTDGQWRFAARRYRSLARR